MSARNTNRAAVFWNDYMREATLTATSEAGEFVVENLQTLSPRERWRSTSAADQTIIADAGQQQNWHLLYIDGHNFNEDATLRIRISDNSDLSNPVYDAEYNAWPSLTGLGEGGLGESGLGGSPITNELKSFQFFSCVVLDAVLTGSVESATATSVRLPKTMARISGGTEYAYDTNEFYVGDTIEITDGTGSGQTRNITAYNANTRTITIEPAWTTTPDTTSAFQLDLSQANSITVNDSSYLGRYFGVTISNTANTDGYLSAGVMSAGPYLQPEFDINFDWEIGFTDPSERTLTYNYDVDVNERTKYRTSSMVFGYLTESEADEFAVDMAADVGASKPVVIIPFLENSARLYKNAIRGLLDEPPRKRQTMQKYTVNAYSVSLTVRGL